MNARLTEPRFGAWFYRPSETSVVRVENLDHAHGVRFLCPCGTGHLTLIDFANPRDGSPPPRVGWQMAGSSLDDLTLTPSIRTFGGPDGAECWHGFVTRGEVTSL